MLYVTHYCLNMDRPAVPEMTDISSSSSSSQKLYIYLYIYIYIFI